MEENANKTQSNLPLTILAAVAVVLAGVLAYVWYSNHKLVGELNEEKEDLTEQIVALRDDYATLSSDYDEINAQLDSSREEVNQLIERLKQTQARDRAQIRKYEKELGTLRSIMRNYIVQIDSLNTLNKKLTADAAAARREAEVSRAKNEELSQQVENLSGKVAAGSIVKATNIYIEPYDGSNKVNERSSRVVRMLTSLTLTANDLAPKGPVRVYIRVKDPEGVLLTNGSSRNFSCGGETMLASASREVDYQGSEVDLSIYLNDIPAYQKGIYTVDVFTSQAKLGSAEVMLR